MSNRCFVCYVRQDEQFVLRLARNLKGKGVPIWLDQWDIPPGADWDRSIDDAIYDCSTFLIVLSSQALESTEVRGELRTALDEKKNIIPVIRSACRVPRQLRNIQSIDFSSREPSNETGLTRILHTLGTSTNIARKPTRHLFCDTLTDGSQGPEMVVVPAGKFKMGDVQGNGRIEEQPVHTVHIPMAFAIGRYQITFEQYDRFATATNRRLPDDLRWGRGRQPAVNVSWGDAVEYAKWLSKQSGKRYRLPTEAEWEYAARAGTEKAYWWGNEMKSGLANCTGCASPWSGKQTAPVGSFPPNPFGLYDTAGNVWEWVQDCWHENYNGSPVDGSGWGDKTSDRRVIRGGSWNVSPENLRSSCRSRGNSGYRGNVVGFRLVRDLS